MENTSYDFVFCFLPHTLKSLPSDTFGSRRFADLQAKFRKTSTRSRGARNIFPHLISDLLEGGEILAEADSPGSRAVDCCAHRFPHSQTPNHYVRCPTGQRKAVNISSVVRLQCWVSLHRAGAGNLLLFSCVLLVFSLDPDRVNLKSKAFSEVPLRRGFGGPTDCSATTVPARS